MIFFIDSFNISYSGSQHLDWSLACDISLLTDRLMEIAGDRPKSLCITGDIFSGSKISNSIADKVGRMFDKFDSVYYISKDPYVHSWTSLVARHYNTSRIFTYPTVVEDLLLFCADNDIRSLAKVTDYVIALAGDLSYREPCCLVPKGISMKKDSPVLTVGSDGIRRHLNYETRPPIPPVSAFRKVGTLHNEACVLTYSEGAWETLRIPLRTYQSVCLDDKEGDAVITNAANELMKLQQPDNVNPSKIVAYHRPCGSKPLSPLPAFTVDAKEFLKIIESATRTPGEAK